MCTCFCGHFFNRNNERATVALFSPSDASARQRGVVVRLNPDLQTNKKQGLWKWYLKFTSPYIQSIHMIHTESFDSVLSARDKTSSEQSRSSHSGESIVFALLFFYIIVHTQHQTLFWHPQKTFVSRRLDFHEDNVKIMVLKHKIQNKIQEN